jgi:hypothetical protein
MKTQAHKSCEAIQTCQHGAATNVILDVNPYIGLVLVFTTETSSPQTRSRKHCLQRVDDLPELKICYL